MSTLDPPHLLIRGVRRPRDTSRSQQCGGRGEVQPSSARGALLPGSATWSGGKEEKRKWFCQPVPQTQPRPEAHCAHLTKIGGVDAATSPEPFGKSFTLLWVFRVKLTTHGWKVEVKGTWRAVPWPTLGQGQLGPDGGRGAQCGLGDCRPWRQPGWLPPTVPCTRAPTRSHAHICTHAHTHTHTWASIVLPRLLQLLSVAPPA